MIVFLALVALTASATQAQVTTECLEANATLYSSDCAEISLQFFSNGSAAGSDVVQSICEVGQSCNTALRAFDTACASSTNENLDDIKSFVSIVLFGCIQDTQRNQYCFHDVFRNGGTVDVDMAVANFQAAFTSAGEICFLVPLGGTCSAQCAAALNNFINSYTGCCRNEIIRFAVTNDLIFRQLILRSYFEGCGLEIPTYCDNSTEPASSCDLARDALFATPDDCSTAARAVADTFFSTNITRVLAFSGCTEKFISLTRECSILFGDTLQISVIANALQDLLVPEAEMCAVPYNSLLAGRRYDNNRGESVCFRDILIGQCSVACANRLVMVQANQAAENCCWNEYTRAEYGQSQNVLDQFTYAVFTDEIYEICDIPDYGFCISSKTVPYSDPVMQCLSARSQILDGTDECSEMLQNLLQATSSAVTSVSNISTAVNRLCNNGNCLSRISDLVNYYQTCIPVLEDDSNFNTNEISNLALAVGNFSCRVHQSSSCLGLYVTQPNSLAQLNAAFNESDPMAPCLRASTTSTCNDECLQVLSGIQDEIGCCLNEFGLAFIGSDVFSALDQACSSMNLVSRCATIGGASIATGFTLLPLLLFGAMATIFAQL